MNNLRQLFLMAPLYLALFHAVAASATEFDQLLSMPLDKLAKVTITTGSLLVTDEFRLASNISVVKEQDWQRNGARRTLDAIEHLPATLTIPFGTGADAIAIRGYAASTSARGITTTLDGIRLNNFSFGTGQYDTPNINLGVLQKIEMIRGPASAIYGSDAFHGVLSFHTFESDFDLDQISFEGSADGYLQGSGRHSSGLTENVRINLAMAGSKQSDQEQQLQFTDFSSGKQQNIEKEMAYTSQTLSIKLVSNEEKNINWRWGVYVDQYKSQDFPVASATDTSGQDTANYMTRLVVTQNLKDDMSFESSGYYRQSDVEKTLSGTNDLEEHFYGLNFTLRQPRQHSKQTQWAVSLGYDADKTDVANLTVPEAPVFKLMGGSRSRDITSLVLEAHTPFFEDSWTLAYGGRLDHYSDFGNQASPRLGIIYNPSPRSAIKLLYGRAFRAPTAFELYVQPIANNTGSLGNPELEPEILDSVELVLMKSGRNWKSNLVFFENHWKEAIVYQPLTPSLGTYTNTGKSREARGVETSVIWVPYPWRIDANASYTESMNKATGESYNLFPRIIANLGISYIWGESNTELTITNRAFNNADDAFEFNPALPAKKLPTFYRVDAVLKRKFGKQTEGSLNILNLFDRENYLPAIAGLENGYPDDPLSISLGIRHDF